MGDNGFHEWHKPEKLAQGSEQPNIVTEKSLNGWQAIDRSSYAGPVSVVGRGWNESEAIADLKQKLIERGLYANI